MLEWDDVTVKQPPIRGLSGRDALSLVATVDGKLATFPLPESGEVLIGRSSSCQMRIDHPSVSRRHARLVLGERIEIEDLGSSNGLRVRERRIEPGQLVEISVGQLVELGSVMLFLRRAVPVARPRRIWPHDYFEARLEEQCARAQDSDLPFTVVRLSFATPPPPGALDEAFAQLRSPDVLALYAPNEYEILFPETRPEEAEKLTQAVRGPLERRGVRVRVRMAHYPIDGDEPDTLIERACEAVQASQAATAAAVSGMERLRRLAEQVAESDLCVLLLGETGVGKEVMAETLHQTSPRAKKKFLRLHCAAMPETLLESELFGHERGAFTGAHVAKPGLFETADGGSVLLDEVGELTLATQVKLLRSIEEHSVMRVGGVVPRPIDVRFIAATNRDLEAEVAAGRFRRDLYYRLNGVTLFIPPLRERQDEIEPLARHFVTQACSRLSRAGEPQISSDVLHRLKRYAWPGNIRELRNTIERAVVLCGKGATIKAEHLPMEKMGAALLTRLPPITHANVPAAVVEGEVTAPFVKLPALGEELGAVEKQRILSVIEQCGGNQSRAARLLGISRNTLASRLDQYGIKRPRK
jgi:DNA-binding NtrC family response regulator